MLKRFCVLFSLFIALPNAAFAQFAGVVVDVADGDTLMVMIDRQLLKLDLTDIDAPETGQPFAERARRSLEQMCEDKAAIVDDLGIGSGRHVFGRVRCAGVDASAEQIRRGMAWVRERDAPADSTLSSLQAAARAEKRGLWSDAAPVPPWKWK